MADVFKKCIETVLRRLAEFQKALGYTGDPLDDNVPLLRVKALSEALQELIRVPP